MGVALGLVVSAIFGLFAVNGGTPEWVLIGTWVLLFVGIVSSILCLIFKRSMSDIEKSQKSQIIEDMERWKGDKDVTVTGEEFVDSLMKEYGDAKVSDLQRILRH